MSEMNFVELNSMADLHSMVFANVFSDINESIIYLTISLSLFFLAGSIIWLTYNLWKNYQAKLIATQRMINQSQLEMKVEYQKLINLYQHSNPEDYLESDFNHLMKETFGPGSHSS